MFVYVRGKVFVGLSSCGGGGGVCVGGYMCGLLRVICPRDSAKAGGPGFSLPPSLFPDPNPDLTSKDFPFSLWTGKQRFDYILTDPSSCFCFIFGFYFFFTP